jgi:tetratricopeptide (TPR) repeat protein
VLFVNLRGFHPDPAQPPADPAAVLDGFLRLLGAPGQRIPHDLPARTAAYRVRLAGTRTLIVLDNAADAEQVRPLLPETPGCPVLVTSRRDLTALHPATHLTVDVFTADEAVAFLADAASRIPVGPDPHAAARIVHRCGRLPLALGLVAAHIRGRAGWTLTDHADRLDEHHHHGRLDTGIQLALDLSYQYLPTDRIRLLRLAALHPGQDFDRFAAAALTETDLASAQAHVDSLCRDHLLQPVTADRYTMHDLVRAHAAARASDEDPPSARYAALTRLFDFYLATAATAMDTLYPAEAHRRPRIPLPSTPIPALAGPDAARGWLDSERPTLVAVAAHTATYGWATHTTRLSTILFRYLTGGHFTDAVAVHGHAHDAAQHTNDPAGQADALISLGGAHIALGRYGPAAEHLQQAMTLFRQAGDLVGEARALNNLGAVEARLGRYQPAVDHYERALVQYRRAGDRTGQARVLSNLGMVEARLGRYQPAADYYELALALCREAGHRAGVAEVLNNLGYVESRLGRHGAAAERLRQALALYRKLGDHAGEAWALDSRGILYTDIGQPVQAIQDHQQALAVFRESGERYGEVWALNGLGEAAHAASRPADALAHHTAACTIATNISDRYQQARAHTGLGYAHRTLGNPGHARQHYQHALSLYTDLGVPAADQIRAHLTAIDNNGHRPALPDADGGLSPPSESGCRQVSHPGDLGGRVTWRRSAPGW